MNISTGNVWLRRRVKVVGERVLGSTMSHHLGAAQTGDELRDNDDREYLTYSDDTLTDLRYHIMDDFQECRSDDDDITYENIEQLRDVVVEKEDDVAMEKENNVAVEEEDEEALKFAPRILTLAMMELLSTNALPLFVRWGRWTRIYSLTRDGDNFATMLIKCKAHKNTLLAVKTSTGAIFGGFTGEAWDTKPGGFAGKFYGNGESFLYSFDLREKKKADRTVSATATVGETSVSPAPQVSKYDDVAPPLKIFPWTGANRYFQVCTTEGSRIAMGGGGGDGTFGLCVSTNFTHGSTGPCETFGNVCLISTKDTPAGERTLLDRDDETSCNFEVVDLEVYGFGSLGEDWACGRVN